MNLLGKFINFSYICCRFLGSGMEALARED